MSKRTYHGVTAAKRATVRARDGHECLRCGAREDLTTDHILPRSSGGTDALANLQTLCKPCNEAKADRSISYLAETWECS